MVTCDYVNISESCAKILKIILIKVTEIYKKRSFVGDKDILYYDEIAGNYRHETFDCFEVWIIMVNKYIFYFILYKL